MKLTGGKYIESESIIVKDETSDTEGYKDNNVYNVYVSLGDKKTQYGWQGVINIMGRVLKIYEQLILLTLLIIQTLE